MNTTAQKQQRHISLVGMWTVTRREADCRWDGDWRSPSIRAALAHWSWSGLGSFFDQSHFSSIGVIYSAFVNWFLVSPCHRGFGS